MRIHQTLILAALCLCVPGTTAKAHAAPAPSLYLSPSGSDATKCTRSAPCATMDRAYRVASPGQIVQLLDGSYAGQSVSADTKKTSLAPVVFRPAKGAEVKIAGVQIYASHLELRNMQTAWHVYPGANGVTLRNVIADDAIFITGASNVSVLGGQVYSPVPVASDSQIASLLGKVPTNILFDGVAFHDFHDIGPGQLHHIECLQVGAAINLTIRNSSFRNCDTHDVFIASWGMANNSPYPLSNIVLENNWFDKTTSGFYAVQIFDELWTGSPRTSFVIRNNSALQAILVRVSNGTALVHGNIIPRMDAYFCDAFGQKQWFDYNVYTAGVTCGPHDRIGDPAYVDVANFDLHLRSGSAALGAGDARSHPALDIDHKLRPLRASPDAGASQRESAHVTLGKSIGNASLGEPRTKIVDFYGAPRRTSKYRVSGRSGTLATFLVHGGRLWVLFDDTDRVAGLGTTSRYYSTQKGDGVGSSVGRVRSSWGLRWLSCQKAYRRSLGTTTVYAVSRRRPVSAPIGSIWMVQRAFDGCGRRPR